MCGQYGQIREVSIRLAMLVELFPTSSNFCLNKSGEIICRPPLIFWLIFQASKTAETQSPFKVKEQKFRKTLFTSINYQNLRVPDYLQTCIFISIHYFLLIHFKMNKSKCLFRIICSCRWQTLFLLSHFGKFVARILFSTN
jgi:hypothetical protein